MKRAGIKGSLAALIIGIPAFSMAIFFCAGQSAPADPSKTAPPVVQITSPATNSTYPWNSLVNYSVVVTDQGKSTEYQEIPSNQVLVTTTYVPDVSKASAEANSAAAPRPDGLLAIVRSNCVGCHAFKAKATGPSFAAIAAHDPDNPATTDLLAKYIREGSTGLWGQVSMPPHPDVTDEQARAMAQWIEKEAANPNVHEYVGTDGAIRMEAPATPGSEAGLILTASYTASTTDREPARRGEATVILHGK